MSPPRPPRHIGRPCAIPTRVGRAVDCLGHKPQRLKFAQSCRRWPILRPLRLPQLRCRVPLSQPGDRGRQVLLTQTRTPLAPYTSRNAPAGLAGASTVRCSDHLNGQQPTTVRQRLWVCGAKSWPPGEPPPNQERKGGAKAASCLPVAENGRGVLDRPITAAVDRPAR
jgi:hypothetical protein